MANRPRQDPPPLPIDTGRVTSLPPTSSTGPPPTSVPNPPSSSSTPPVSEPSTPPSSQPPSSSSPPPSSSQPPLSSSAPPLSSSAPQSQPDTSSTPAPLPASDTPPPTPSTTLPTSSFTTSFTTIVTTRSDGSTFTTTSALPTALASATAKHNNSPSRVGIIAGTTATGIIILLILLGVVFAYRRNKLQKLWDEIALRSSTTRRRERKGLLEDEDFDDDVGGGGGMRMYREVLTGSTGGISGGTYGHSRGPSATSSGFGSYPLNNLGASNTAYNTPHNPFNPGPSPVPSTPTTQGARSLRTGAASPSPAPSIFRAHTSESGSIFKEELGGDEDNGNDYLDPFAGHGGNASGSVVSLVPMAAATAPIMARSGSTTPPGSTRGLGPHARASPPIGALASPNVNQIQSLTAPTPGPTANIDREIGTMSMTSSTPTHNTPTPRPPSPVSPGYPLPTSYSTTSSSGYTTPTPSHAPTFANPNTHALPGSNTMTSAGTGTIASMYSTSGVSARTSEFGFVSRGSTPVAPVPPLPTQYRTGGGGGMGLPPGAAPSITPGSPNVYAKSSYSSLHSQVSDVSHVSGTSGSESMYSQASAPYSYSYQPQSYQPQSYQLQSYQPPTQLAPPLPEAGIGFDNGRGFGDEREIPAPLNIPGQHGPAGSNGLKMPASQPKRSSPLARVLSTDAKIFPPV